MGENIVLIGSCEGDFESLLPTTTMRWVKLSSSCQLQLQMLAVKGPSGGLGFFTDFPLQLPGGEGVWRTVRPAGDQQRGRGRRFHETSDHL